MKLTTTDQRTLARWAADCARRVLPLFERARPGDGRPRAAILLARRWARGEVGYREVRAAALAAHAAARAAGKDTPACFAARAAGHAVATGHVATHAPGAALYAARAAAADAARRAADAQLDWARRHAPRRLRGTALPEGKLRFGRSLRAAP